MIRILCHFLINILQWQTDTTLVRSIFASFTTCLLNHHGNVNFPEEKKSDKNTSYHSHNFCHILTKKIWQTSLRMKGNIQFHFAVKDVSLANKNATCLKQKRNLKLSWYYKNIDTGGQNVFCVCSISIKTASTKPAKA